MIPAVTESSTRLPPGAPLATSQDAPLLQGVQLGLLVAFLVGVTGRVLDRHPHLTRQTS